MLYSSIYFKVEISKTLLFYSIANIERRMQH